VSEVLPSEDTCHSALCTRTHLEEVDHVGHLGGHHPGVVDGLGVRRPHARCPLDRNAVHAVPLEHVLGDTVASRMSTAF